MVGRRNSEPADTKCAREGGRERERETTRRLKVLYCTVLYCTRDCKRLSDVTVCVCVVTRCAHKPSYNNKKLEIETGVRAFTVVCCVL